MNRTKDIWLLIAFSVICTTANVESRAIDDNLRDVDLPAEVNENPEDLFRDFFDDDIDELMGSRAVDFSKPPQPSYMIVVLRKVGTPLFLHYVTFYTYLRNWARWLKAKTMGFEYIPVGSQHYAQI